MCKDKIYIYGGSGHGLVVADIARALGYKEIIFIDDGANNNYPSFKEIKENTHTPIILAVGNNNVRKHLYNKVIAHNFKVITLIHPSAIISPSVTIGAGVVIMPNVIINSQSNIGKCAILNTSAVVEHENSIGDFTHLSPMVTLSGNVTIKTLTHIGVGTVIKQGITVGENSIIGAGSVVVKDMEKNKICFGNPCKVIRNNK